MATTYELAATARTRYDSCPLCGHAAFSKISAADCTGHPLYKDGLPEVMVWLQCDDCRHVFVDGYFTPDALSLLFSSTQQTQQVGHELEAERFRHGRMVDRIIPYVPTGLWLDVGVGNGSLIFAADEYGFSAVGTDLRKDNVARLIELGYEAHCNDIVELDMPSRFDVLSMADVLEHMPYPGRALTAAATLLRTGGVLLVSMPNMECEAWRAADRGGYNPFWGEIEHYHNFSKTRLVNLLREYGFTFLKYGISERYRMCMEILVMKD